MSDRLPNRPPTPRPLADTDDTAIDDTVADRTLIVDMDRTEVDSAARDRTEVDRPRRDDRRPPPSPMGSEEETRLDRPDEATAGMEELRRLGQSLVTLFAQMGRWLVRRILRPGVRGLEHGLRRLTDLFRSGGPEDSDAYSRRRGQEWRRFREGDPSINELGEFDQKHRKKPKKPDRD